MVNHFVMGIWNNLNTSFICGFFLIGLGLSSCNTKEVYSGDEYVITKVNVIDVNGNATQGTQDVVVRGDSIFLVGSYKHGENATIIDGAGKYLMPGLTEMHAHIPVAEEGNDTLVHETLFLYLSQGVTTIRGMLGDPYHLELKQLIKNKEILSPRVYTSSPSVNGGSVQTIEEAKSKVSQYKQDGFDFLKIHPGVKLDVWDQIETTANEVGIAYAGHVPVEVGIHRALDSRYATIDHLDGYMDGLIPQGVDFDKDGGGFFGYAFTDLVDTELIPELVKKTIDKGVAVVPTQTLFTRWFSPEDPTTMMQAPEMQYMPAKTRFAWRQNKEQMIGNEGYNKSKWKKYIEIRKQLLSEMDRQGVNILLGSDAPQVMNVPGFSIHHEMKAMAEAGMGTESILKSGTVAPASFFGAEGEFGEIKIGYSADLILLNQNPLTDIGNSTSIAGVMVRGEWLSRERIDERLSEIAERNK